MRLDSHLRLALPVPPSSALFDALPVGTSDPSEMAAGVSGSVIIVWESEPAMRSSGAGLAKKAVIVGWGAVADGSSTRVAVVRTTAGRVPSSG